MSWSVMRTLVVALGVVVGAMVPISSHAASIVARSVEYMAKHADAVVQGTVTASRTEIDGRGAPFTVQTLAVTRRFRGSVGETMELWRVGGPLPDGSIIAMSGDHDLSVGDEVVLFAATDELGRTVSFLLGWSVFEVEPGGVLRRHRDDFGVYVEGPGGVIAPGDAHAATPPATVVDLARRIAEVGR